jgi:hypothetical protein
VACYWMWSWTTWILSALSPFPQSVLKPYFCIISFPSGHFLRSFCTQILASFVQPFCCYYSALDVDQYYTIMQGAHHRWSLYVGWEWGAHMWFRLAVSNRRNRLVPFSPNYHQKNGRVTFFKISWHIKP